MNTLAQQAVLEARRYVNSIPYGDLATFAMESGLSVHWVHKFRSGGLPNPTTNRVSAVLAHKQRRDAQHEREDAHGYCK